MEHPASERRSSNIQFPVILPRLESWTFKKRAEKPTHQHISHMRTWSQEGGGDLIKSVLFLAKKVKSKIRIQFPQWPLFTFFTVILSPLSSVYNSIFTFVRQRRKMLHQKKCSHFEEELDCKWLEAFFECFVSVPIISCLWWGSLKSWTAIVTYFLSTQ